MRANLPSLLAILIVCLGTVLTSQGQNIPDFGPVFPQNEVTSIYITIDPDSLEWMISNLDNEHEFQAAFVFESQTLVDTLSLIGLRLRGNTSLNAAKKSFKISFNTFDPGGHWQNLEKLNLLATVTILHLCEVSYRMTFFAKWVLQLRALPTHAYTLTTNIEESI